MHDCQATTEQLPDLAFGTVAGAAQFGLLRELQTCDDCRVEYLSYKATLRAFDRAAPAAEPPEIYWEIYQTKLRQQLRALETRSEPAPQMSWWQRLWTTSIRVPVPVAALATLLVVAGGVWAWRNTQRLNVPALTVNAPAVPPPATTEKVVVKETVVTPAPPEIIYRDRVVTRTVYQPRRAAPPPAAIRPETTAQSAPETPKTEPLVGFAPPEKVVLQVTKNAAQEK